MKTLNLIISQKDFDAIIKGEKVVEYREIRPATAMELVELDEEDYLKEDERGNAIPIKYDAIRYNVGRKKGGKTASLVEVKNAYCVLLTQTLKCPDGKPMKFYTDEEGRVAHFLVDDDDKLVTDEHGDYIQVEYGTEEYLKGMPIPTNTDEGATIEEPIEYEHDGNIWFEEMVVYDLGKIIEQ